MEGVRAHPTNPEDLPLEAVDTGKAIGLPSLRAWARLRRASSTTCEPIGCLPTAVAFRLKTTSTYGSGTCCYILTAGCAGTISMPFLETYSTSGTTWRSTCMEVGGGAASIGIQLGDWVVAIPSRFCALKTVMSLANSSTNLRDCRCVRVDAWLHRRTPPTACGHRLRIPHFLRGTLCSPDSLVARTC